MNYVGVDLHKETATFSVRDSGGKNIITKMVPTSRRALAKMFASLPKPFEVGLEATYNWYYFVDVAERFASRVWLGHPYDIKAFAKRHKHTDPCDARLISRLMHIGVFPKVHITSKEGRKLKELIRSYLRMVADRTRTITRTRAFADRHGKPLPAGTNLTTLKGVGQARRMRWSAEEREVIEDLLDQTEFLTKKINRRRLLLKARVKTDTDMLHLTSIPGFDTIAAFIVRSEIDEIARFKNSAQFIAYCGLAPDTRESGGRRYRTRLMKNASHHLKWIFIQNALIFARFHQAAGERWERKAKRTNKTKARLDTARLLCKIAYTVLKKKRRFRTNP